MWTNLFLRVYFHTVANIGLRLIAVVEVDGGRWLSPSFIFAPPGHHLLNLISTYTLLSVESYTLFCFVVRVIFRGRPIFFWVQAPHQNGTFTLQPDDRICYS